MPAAVVTRGYGPGASIAFIVTRGYSSGAAVVDVGTQYLIDQVALDIPQYFAVALENDAIAADLQHILTDTAMGWAEALVVGGTTYYGIFDDESIEFGSRDKDPPSILVQATDAEGWSHGATVTFRGLTYYIAGLQPDGVGVVRVILEPPQ